MQSQNAAFLARDVKTPQSDFYPGVYWFWHHIPPPGQIEQQLKEIHHAGYRTILIQPRLAFPMRDYLSPGYLAAYRHAMRAAKSLGLTAGLYDDYNWISGHAGGRTVAGHDHLRERHLFWSAAEIRDGTALCSISGIHNNLGDGLGEAFMHWVYEAGEPRWDDWQMVRAYVSAADGTEIDVTADARITDAGASGCRVQLDLRGQRRNAARATVFVSARCCTSRLVNYLHPGTAERFIEAGYEPYKNALSDFFGDPLTFLFFDQPYAGFYTWNERFGNPLNSLMYAESLEHVFEQTHGYDVGKALYALVSPETAQSPRLRCDFFETYGELARQRFLAPLAAWAGENGLGFSGHELLGFVGEWGFAAGLPALDSRVNFGADYFAVDAYKTISAVDACNYHPQVSARFGGSAAQVHGRRGCMIEQYSVPVGREMPAPAGQWDLTLHDMRSQAVRHALFGANKFIFHAFYQTNTQDVDATPLQSPRFDFPPGINFMPWFRFHPLFAEELARLNTFLAQAEPQKPVALLYPLRTYWHDGPSQSFNEESAFWNRWLSENRLGYAIIPEDWVDAALLWEQGFKALVLPAVSVLKDKGFLDQLEAFVSNGGCVIASGALPCASQQSGVDPEIHARLSTLFVEHEQMMHYEDWHAAAEDPGLCDRLAQFQQDIRLERLDGLATPLWIWQGSSPNSKSIALFNDSDKERLVSLSLPGRHSPVIYDLSTGDRQRWGWYRRDPQQTQVTLPLAPHAVVCLEMESEADTITHPHLVELSGDATVSRAVLDEDGNLDLKLRCFRSGRVQLTIANASRPDLMPIPGKSGITAVAPGLWQVDVELPEMPGVLVLDEGWRLRIPGEYRAVPVSIDEGWERLYPNYAGAGYYRCHFPFSEEDRSFRWVLAFEEVVTSLVVYVNQVRAGVCGWPPYSLILPSEALKLSYNELEIAVWNTAGNACYSNTPYQRAVPHPAGLIGAPRLVPFLEIDLFAMKNANEGELK